MEWEDILRDVQAREWGSLDELNAHLAEKARLYNTASQRRLSGLSPEQAGRLFADDWEGDGPLQLNAKIPLAELRRARFLVNARVVLSTLEERGPVKATASTKRFPRSFVATAMDRMERGDRLYELARTYKDVMNEMDYFPLHLQRIILRMAGLIKLHGGKFSLTQLGRSHLKEERAGELYALLFRTYFRRFNLAYLDAYEQNAALQQTIAMTFYRLRRAGRSWKTPAALAEEMLMEEALDQPLDFRGKNEAYGQFESRVLRPLEEFGLVEKRDEEGPNEFLPSHTYRTSKLFGRFIRFDNDLSRIRSSSGPGGKTDRSSRSRTNR